MRSISGSGNCYDNALAVTLCDFEDEIDEGCCL